MTTSSPTGEVGEAALPIIAGDVDTDDSGAVLIMIKKVSFSKPFEWCTGAVVSPHVIVTAAHCVAVTPADVPADAKLSVFVGPAYDYDVPPTDPSLFYEIAETHIDPDYKDATAQTQGHDIAVLVTRDPLPVTPFEMIDGPLDDSVVGATVRLIGAGANVLPSTGKYSTGVRKVVSLPITKLDPLYLQEEGAAGSTCVGDSGGPTLLMRDGRELLLGIHAATVGVPECTGVNYDTRIDLYAQSFIAPIVAQADPGFSGSGGAGGAGGASSTTSTTSGGSSPARDERGGCAVGNRPSGSAWSWGWVACAVVALRRRVARRAR